MFGSAIYCLSFSLLLFCLVLPAPTLAQSASFSGSRTLFGVDPQLAKAQRALERGHDLRAVRYAHQVLRHSSRSHDRRSASLILCSAYRDRGELEASLEACDRALRLTRGEDWRVFANRAQTLLLLNRQREGVQSYLAAIADLSAEVEGAWRVPAGKREWLATLEARLLEAAQGKAGRFVARQLPASPNR